MNTSQLTLAIGLPLAAIAMVALGVLAAWIRTR